MSASNYLRFYTSSFLYVPRGIFPVTLITDWCVSDVSVLWWKKDEICATQTLLKLQPSGLRYVSIAIT
jgi:hypothetical protein